MTKGVRVPVRVRVQVPVAVSVAVAVVLGVGGCSGDSAPEAEPTSVVTSAPDPSPTGLETPDLPVPEMPAVASEKTQRGAEAFVRYWFDTVNYANLTGKTEFTRAVSDPECASCEALATGAENLYRKSGGAMRGGEYLLKNVIAPEVPPDGIVSVSVDYSREPAVLVASNGDETAEPGDPTKTLGAVINYDDSTQAWVFVDLGSYD